MNFLRQLLCIAMQRRNGFLVVGTALSSEGISEVYFLLDPEDDV